MSKMRTPKAMSKARLKSRNETEALSKQSSGALKTSFMSSIRALSKQPKASFIEPIMAFYFMKILYSNYNISSENPKNGVNKNHGGRKEILPLGKKGHFVFLCIIKVYLPQYCSFIEIFLQYFNFSFIKTGFHIPVYFYK